MVYGFKIIEYGRLLKNIVYCKYCNDPMTLQLVIFQVQEALYDILTCSEHLIQGQIRSVISSSAGQTKNLTQTRSQYPDQSDSLYLNIVSKHSYTFTIIMTMTPQHIIIMCSCW